MGIVFATPSYLAKISIPEDKDQLISTNCMQIA